MLILFKIPGGYRLEFVPYRSNWGDWTHPYTREELRWFRRPLGDA